MIPQAPSVSIGNEVEEVELVSRTYKLTGDRITGFISGLDTIKQAVFKILQTERYQNVIYNFNYGSEFLNLLGKSKDYVKNDVKRVITEALTADIRITSISDFSIEENENEMLIKFKVASTEGEFITSTTLPI